MPMKAVYDTIDGEIVSEVRDGVRRDYLPDPLGSTAALLDSSQTKIETASYWPYGEQRGTGMLSTPFGYVGTFGYYADDTDRVYVRARTLLTKKARWLTKAAHWPVEGAYEYGLLNPLSTLDLSGYDALIIYGPDRKSGNRTWNYWAELYARYYEECNRGKRAHVAWIRNLDDLKFELSYTKDIDTLIYVGHAGVPGSTAYPMDAKLFLNNEKTPGSDDILASQIRDLPTQNVNPNAFILLVGCGTAATINQPKVGEYQGYGLPKGHNSLAKEFAKRFKTRVYGFLPHITPGECPGAFFGSDGWRTIRMGVLYFHLGWHPIFPVAIPP
jgi:hypothetical protein